jgi:hypothetical protein
MLANVINTAKIKKGRIHAISILPLLVRGYPEALEVETLLRPQMLIMQSRLNRAETTMFDKDRDLYTNEVLVES